MDLSAVYEITNFSIGDTKSGTKMGKLQLKNTQDDTPLNCILWEETLNRIEPSYFRTGNLIRILGGTYNEKFNNCLITNIEVVKEAKLGLEETEREEVFAKVLGYVEKIQDKKLREYISSLIFENEEKFKIVPAAKVMHHNYLGGLLQHIFECLQYAELILKNSFRKLNPDSVYAACILHDFGKIFEYKIDEQTGLIDYNDEFQKEWITHSQWGYSNCMMAGFKEIARMIAAHHGRTEWGAIIDLNQRDLDGLLYLTHHIDDLSAKYGKTSVSDL